MYNITLKLLKHAHNMSEETNAFTADVFFGDKFIGHAKNDGHGGQTWVAQYTLTEGQRKASDECGELLSAQPPYYGHKLTVDDVVDHLVHLDLIASDLKRKCSRKIMLIKAGEVWEQNPPKGWTANKAVKHPSFPHKAFADRGEVIINTMSKKELVEALEPLHPMYDEIASIEDDKDRSLATVAKYSGGSK